MKVLSFVTNRYSPFYQQQTNVLERRGIDITHSFPRKQGQNYMEQTTLSRTYHDYVPLFTDSIKGYFSQYNIIHANYALTAPFALTQIHRPVVVSFWGSDLMENKTKLAQTCAKLADRVILPSPAMEPYLDCEYTIIPFGVDTDLFSSMSQTKVRKKVGWDLEKNIILFPYPKSKTVKNYALAKRVVSQIENAELKSISSVPHEKMPYYLNASDCVLVTSRRESGPMVVKEATLCNVPVVTTDVGFAPEVLSDVENSYVCSSERELIDRLEFVLKSGKQSDGRKYTDEWGLDRMGERLVEVYESAVNEQ